MEGLEGRKSDAWDRAVADLQQTDLKAAADRGLVKYEETSARASILFECFGHPFRLMLPGFELESPASVDYFTLKVLALRYLCKADCSPVTGEWIAYRDLPGGMFYAATIPPTVEEPLAEAFGYQRWSLTDTAPLLHGRETEYGDESFVFHAFPRVPLLIVLHWGDEEFPPSVRFLFDRCCSHYLNTDDCKILATQTTSLLIKLAGQEFKGGSGDEDNPLWMVD
jgi:hypothetical protein